MHSMFMVWSQWPFLEFSGYALQTSYAYGDNILDYFFGIRNFSLAMAIFFALYFPLGN